MSTQAFQLPRIVEAVSHDGPTPFLGSQVEDELPLDERTQGLPQDIEVFDRLHPAGASAQLTLRLRSAQEQLREDGQLDLADVPGIVEQVSPALHATAD